MSWDNGRRTAVSGFEEKQRLGLRVALGLALLTVAEFIVAVALDEGPVVLYLLPFLAGKAWLIMDYFMHIRDISDQGPTNGSV